MDDLLTAHSVLLPLMVAALGLIMLIAIRREKH